jgi:ferredoxin, 2Fe-2S
MAKVVYVEADGTKQVVETEVGQSVMEAAVKNGVPGIVGECGGVCACATCKVRVDALWLEATGERSQIESETLAFLGDGGSGLRLSCQLKMRAELDGLIVHTPETQY